MMLKKTRGFTLIELMIVVAIVGIVAAFAYPSYREQVIKSRRAEGMGELLELADRMERFFSDRGTYVGATLGNAATDIYPATTEKGHYALAIPTQTAIAFSVTAAPLGQQLADDTKCGTFSITSLGVKGITGTASLENCWK
jgi:type IV pilus assembly protein PilE